MFSRWSPCSCSTSPYSGCSTTVPLHANSFLHARTIFFRSYSDESPCTVVSVLRPFRCCMRTWTSPSCTSSSELLIASANGSNVLRFWMDIRLNVYTLCSNETLLRDDARQHQMSLMSDSVNATRRRRRRPATTNLRKLQSVMADVRAAAPRNGNVTRRRKLLLIRTIDK